MAIVNQAFGIVTHGNLDIRTVSPTRQGALVNWLVATAGIALSNAATPDAIETLWSHYAPQFGQAECHYVTIMVSDKSEPATES